MMAGSIEKECNVVLVGKTGTGKSSLGNSLLGTKVFKFTKSPKSVTVKCERRRTNLQDGTLLTIVDSPGLFDTSSPNVEIVKEIIKCIALCTPGPDVILFVLSLKRFTKEEVETIDILKKLFGADAMKHVIIVFTGKDQLDDEDEDEEIKSVHDYIKHSPQYLKNLIHECDFRYVAISNKPKGLTHKSDVQDVMKIIYKTMETNNNQVYSAEAFAKAEQTIKDEIKRRTRTSRKSEEEIREDMLNGIQSDREVVMEILGNGLSECISHAFGIPRSIIGTAISLFRR